MVTMCLDYLIVSVMSHPYRSGSRVRAGVRPCSNILVVKISRGWIESDARARDSGVVCAAHKYIEVYDAVKANDNARVN